MNAWTQAAKDEMNRFLMTLRQPLEQAGADAAEVTDDIRRHVEEEVAAARLRVVTVTELKPLLARIGEPWRENGGLTERGEPGAMLQAPVAIAEPPPDPEHPVSFEVPEAVEDRNHLAGENRKPGSQRRKGPKPSGFLVIFGVVIPALTLIFEWASGFCARNVFDPIPTFGHLALVALVPLINTVAFAIFRRERVLANARSLSIALGFSAAISAVYCVAFIPLALPGLIALMVGIGILPLSPYFALAETLIMRRHLRDTVEGTQHAPQQRFWLGAVAAVIAFFVVDMRYMGTTAAMQLATNPSTEQLGLGWLRTIGDEDTVLRGCYSDRSREFKSALLWLLPTRYQVTTEQARNIFFRLYGRPFNSVAPSSSRLAGLIDPWAGERFDPERGGEKVGTPVAGLTMDTSRLDATVEPKGALSYLEWIFEFENSSFSPAEARCEIELPPGAVVSRLTLWVNGDEREAAFAGKSQVRAAYENVVVVQRRDPVLVTSSGKDRILMQCFPVTANGGRMKVRVGMTVPLLLDGEKNGVLRWPYIRERNFALGEKLEHSFWIDSPVPVEPFGLPLKIERTASGHYMARGKLTEHDEAIVQPAVLIRRDGATERAWAKDTRGDGGAYIVQEIREMQRPAARDIVVVLDRSVTMEKIARQLAEFRPLARSVRVVVANETLREFKWDSTQNARSVIEKIGFTGGQDNIPALERAWDLAAENGAGAVIWMHGPQPVLLSSMEGLKQRFERRRNAVVMYDLPIERGPNAIAAKMPAWAKFESVSLHRAPMEMLDQVLREVAGSSKRYEAVRERKTDAEALGLIGSAAAESNLHLARLWAFDQIQRLARAGRTDEALELAGRYQLVTEVSGAVVLETARQYEQAGLQPVGPLSVPVVPEPGTCALLLLGGLMLWAVRKKLLRTEKFFPTTP